MLRAGKRGRLGQGLVKGGRTGGGESQRRREYRYMRYGILY